MVLGQVHIYVQKNEVGPLSYIAQKKKINSKYIINQNVRTKTIKKKLRKI